MNTFSMVALQHQHHHQHQHNHPSTQSDSYPSQSGAIPLFDSNKFGV
jgi:hypothetical protein